MNEYRSIIDEYVARVKEELKEDLKLLLIIGSSSSPRVIRKWSDIDVILVLSEYTFALVEKLKKISASYDVKIGTTIYSQAEFLRMNIDPKTYYHLYLLNKKLIEIQYKSDDVVIPSISYDEIYKTHLPYLLWRIHIYKRQFLYETLNKEQIRSIYKMTYLIMKAILIIDGEFPRNYEEVFNLFSQKYDFEYFDYEKFIDDFLTDNIEYENIITYAKKFLLFVIERY